MLTLVMTLLTMSLADVDQERWKNENIGKLLNFQNFVYDSFEKEISTQSQKSFTKKKGFKFENKIKNKKNFRSDRVRKTKKMRDYELEDPSEGALTGELMYAESFFKV